MQFVRQLIVAPSSQIEITSGWKRLETSRKHSALGCQSFPQPTVFYKNNATILKFKLQETW